MNTHIVEAVAGAVLELALIIGEPDDGEQRRAARMRTAAERVVTMCAGDAVTAVAIAASLVDVDAPVRDWRAVLPGPAPAPARLFEFTPRSV